MAPNPICCPFEKGKFTLGDRHTQRECDCDVKTHRGDSHVPGWMCLIAQERRLALLEARKGKEVFSPLATKEIQLWRCLDMGLLTLELFDSTFLLFQVTIVFGT